MITIIGIDPGLSATGVGIVRGNGRSVAGYSFGSISTSKNNSLSNRLDHIFSKLLQVLKNEKPDLVLLDLRMPKLDGFGFLEKINIREDDPYNVVVITGHGNDREVEKSFELGVNFFLHKPLSLVEVRCLAKRCLEMKALEKELPVIRQGCGIGFPFPVLGVDEVGAQVLGHIHGRQPPWALSSFWAHTHHCSGRASPRSSGMGTPA